MPEYWLYVNKYKLKRIQKNKLLCKNFSGLVPTKSNYIEAQNFAELTDPVTQNHNNDLRVILIYIGTHILTEHSKYIKSGDIFVLIHVYSSTFPPEVSGWV